PASPPSHPLPSRAPSLPERVPRARDVVFAGVFRGEFVRAGRARYQARARCIRTEGGYGDQSPRDQCCPLVGAVVLELPGGIKKRRLDENAERKPAGEILFCLDLE